MTGLCSHLVNGIRYGLAQSDPIKWILLFILWIELIRITSNAVMLLLQWVQLSVITINVTDRLI
jgi:hypothetical protein